MSYERCRKLEEFGRWLLELSGSLLVDCKLEAPGKYIAGCWSLDADELAPRPKSETSAVSCDGQLLDIFFHQLWSPFHHFYTCSNWQKNCCTLRTRMGWMNQLG